MSAGMEFMEQHTKSSSAKKLLSQRTSRQVKSAENKLQPSMARTVFLISTLNATVLVGAMNTGMLTVALPHITVDLHVAQSLQLWPALVYSLASGCTLLLAGAIADVVGSRAINILGTFLLGASILASGLARTGIELVLFRSLQGIGVAMCFPTAVSILSTAFPHGRVRNIAFGCLGLGTPLGFAVGIILEGCLESVGIGWRAGFFVCAAMTSLLCFVNFWQLPKDFQTQEIVWSRLKTEVDWLGVMISSTSMGLLSYSLSVMAENPSSILQPANILLFIIAIAMIPLFVIWMRVQEARGKPALIPNSLWKSSTFTAICLMVLLSWATLQSMEWFLSLFYQQVQRLSPLQTAVRYLPNIIAGSILNIATGLLVHRIAVNHYVTAVSAICTIAPLLMALVDPTWSWWWCTFWVMLLLPISVDVNFTVANLVITDIFPSETQALAGAVYQTVAQLGISISIAIMAIISNSVTEKSSFTDKSSPQALLEGFRAVFWACLAMMILSTAAGAWGLRGLRSVSTKEDHQKSAIEARKSRVWYRHSIKDRDMKSRVVSFSLELPPFDRAALPNILASLGLDSKSRVDSIVEMYDYDTA